MYFAEYHKVPYISPWAYILVAVFGGLIHGGGPIHGGAYTRGFEMRQNFHQK